MLTAWARNWWTLVIRGIAAVLFGLLTLFAPGISLAALILLFACYAIVDGVFNLVGTVRGMAHHQRWGESLLEGVVSLAAGVVALLWPGLSALALLFWIAAWAIVTGVLELGAAIRLRRLIQGEWLLALSGVLSVVFGVLVVVSPGAGALAVLFWIAVYALAFGALLITLGMRVRKLAAHDVQPPEHAVPA